MTLQSSSANPLTEVTIELMGRTFKIGCPKEEHSQLLSAVAYLNREMQKIKNENKVIGNERIMLLAALHISHELLNIKANQGFDMTKTKHTITNMIASIDEALLGQDRLF